MRAAVANVFVGRARFAERDVLAHRAVEEKIVLHHHADMRAIVAKPYVRDVVSVDEHASALRMIERHDESDERTLSAATRADQRGRRSRSAR